MPLDTPGPALVPPGDLAEAIEGAVSKARARRTSSLQSLLPASRLDHLVCSLLGSLHSRSRSSSSSSSSSSSKRSNPPAFSGRCSPCRSTAPPSTRRSSRSAPSPRRRGRSWRRRTRRRAPPRPAPPRPFGRSAPPFRPPPCPRACAAVSARAASAPAPQEQLDEFTDRLTPVFTAAKGMSGSARS